MTEVEQLKSQLAELQGMAEARLQMCSLLVDLVCEYQKDLDTLEADKEDLIGRLNEADDTIGFLEHELETAREESQD